MKPTTKDKFIDLIQKLKKQACDGDLEALEALLAVGRESAMALHSMAFFSGVEARSAVRQLAEKEISWPMNYNVMKDARIDEYNPENICDELNLGGKSGYILQPKTRPRELDIEDKTGWALWVFGEMSKHNIEITKKNAVKFIKDHPEIQLLPSSIKNHAAGNSKENLRGMKEALGAAFDDAITRLRV